MWRIQWYRTSFGASDTSDGEEHISQASPAPTAAAATAAAAEALRSLTTQRVGLGLRKQRPITWRSTRAPLEGNQRTLYRRGEQSRNGRTTSCVPQADQLRPDSPLSLRQAYAKRPMSSSKRNLSLR